MVTNVKVVQATAEEIYRELGRRGFARTQLVSVIAELVHLTTVGLSGEKIASEVSP